VPGAQPWQHPGVSEVQQQQYTLGFQQRLHRRQNTTVPCRRDAPHHDASGQAQAHAYERGKHHVRDAPPFVTSLYSYTALHGADLQRKRDVCHFARTPASSPSSGGDARNASQDRRISDSTAVPATMNHCGCVMMLQMLWHRGIIAASPPCALLWRAMSRHGAPAFAVATGHSHFHWLHKYRGGCEPNASSYMENSLRLRSAGVRADFIMRDSEGGISCSWTQGRLTCLVNSTRSSAVKAAKAPTSASLKPKKASVSLSSMYQVIDRCADWLTALN
jgi:hypothetical protein